MIPPTPKEEVEKAFDKGFVFEQDSPTGPYMLFRKWDDEENKGMDRPMCTIATPEYVKAFAVAAVESAIAAERARIAEQVKALPRKVCKIKKDGKEYETYHHSLEDFLSLLLTP